jgi:predicted ATPase/DNA-binding XRE family transcriptional regulator
MDGAVPSRTETFGDLLRRYRLDAGLTQEALAERSGLSVRGISDPERGARTHPQHETIRLLEDPMRLVEADRVALGRAARRSPAPRPASVVLAPSPSQPWPGAQLPVPLDLLIGRDAEVGAVVARFHDPKVRLLTLLGPGGIGKTRLAIAAGTALSRTRFARLAFVALGAIATPEQVIPTIANALDLAESGGRSPAKALTAALRGSPTLLVLDTFEQVVGAAVAVAELLTGCPELTVLVTSRVPLRVAGEHHFSVGPLAVPDARPAIEAAVAADAPAVRLFVVRARAVDPSFMLWDDNAVDVAAICRRLDGVPLAIELAAARIAHLPPALLRPRLERRLSLLTGGARDAPPRQRTLRDTIAWSYDLLAANEQALFRHLGVFAGGFGLESAAAVVGDGRDEAAVLDGVATLLDANLLVRRAPQCDEPRFAMLDTIREFALEQLATSGEEAAARESHAAYFLSLAERAEPELFGAQPEVWTGRLSADHANLVEALAWHQLRGDVIALARLAATLREYWFFSGRRIEGLRWLECAVEQVAAMPDGVAGKLLWATGYMAHCLGIAARSVPLLEQARALRRHVGDAIGEAHCVFCLGMTALDQEDFVAAESFLAESHRVWMERGDRISAMYAEFHLGIAFLGQGHLERATVWAKASYDHAVTLGSAHAAHLSAFVLVDVALAAGDVVGAVEWYRRAFSDATAIDKQEMGNSREAIVMYGGSVPMSVAGALATAATDYERGVRLFGAAARLREELGAGAQSAQEKMHERAVHAARASLGAERFEAAWTVGRGLAVEEVVAEIEAALATAEGWSRTPHDHPRLQTA